MLCLATLLFAIFTLGLADIGPVVTLLALVQVALAFATLLVTHLTLRTVFRRGAAYEAAAIAESAAFRSVPVVVVGVGLFHLLLLKSVSSAVGEFGARFTWDVLVYVFALALGWHLLTSWMLRRAPLESD